MGDFEEALANFNDTLLYLRGNNSIDYEQLGLKFKLYACETLFNRGLCYIYLQQMDAGMQDLQFAANEKANADHDVIDEAIREQAEVCHFSTGCREKLNEIGIHCLLHTRWYRLQTECCQGQKLEDKRLLGQSPPRGGYR